MLNIEATKIKKGITFNSYGSKRVKISNFEELVKNARELGAEVDSKKVEVPTEWNAEVKPEWELVNMNSEKATAYRDPKAVRIRKDGIENCIEKYGDLRGENIYGNTHEVTPENEVTSANDDDYSNDYSSNISTDLESFGFSPEFSQATESVVGKENIPEFNYYEFKPEDFVPEQPSFAEEKEATQDFDFEERRVEEEQPSFEEDNSLDGIEAMVREAIEKSKEEETIENDDKKEVSFDFNSINNFNLAGQGLMDVIKASERKLKEGIEANKKTEEAIAKIEISTGELERAKGETEEAIQEYLAEVNSKQEAEAKKAQALEKERRESMKRMMVIEQEYRKLEECRKYIEDETTKSKVA